MSHVHTEDAKLLSFSDISELKSFLNENYLNRQQPLFTFCQARLRKVFPRLSPITTFMLSMMNVRKLKFY